MFVVQLPHCLSSSGVCFLQSPCQIQFVLNQLTQRQVDLLHNDKFTLFHLLVAAFYLTSLGGVIIQMSCSNDLGEVFYIKSFCLSKDASPTDVIIFSETREFSDLSNLLVNQSDFIHSFNINRLHGPSQHSHHVISLRS